jgi:hypothetical protein
MKKLIALLFVLILSGCANGIPTMSYSSTTPEALENTEKLFVGVPVLLSMEGSSARLNEDWIVTVKHNSLIMGLQGVESYEHPTCDIALIKSKGDNVVPTGKLYSNDKVVHVGYPVGMPLSVNEGVYLGDTSVRGWGECSYSATTGVVMSGMSGGGVYNAAGELVGVNHGFATGELVWPDGRTADSPAVFLSLFAVEDWIEEVTGLKLYAN